MECGSVAPSDHPSAKEKKRLAAELSELSQQQADALKAWAYLGVTDHAFQEYDQRRKRIGELTQILRRLDNKAA